jgi:hypothetical protein
MDGNLNPYPLLKSVILAGFSQPDRILLPWNQLTCLVWKIPGAGRVDHLLLSTIASHHLASLLELTICGMYHRCYWGPLRTRDLNRAGWKSSLVRDYFHHGSLQRLITDSSWLLQLTTFPSLQHQICWADDCDHHMGYEHKACGFDVISTLFRFWQRSKCPLQTLEVSLYDGNENIMISTKDLSTFFDPIGKTLRSLKIRISTAVMVPSHLAQCLASPQFLPQLENIDVQFCEIEQPTLRADWNDTVEWVLPHFLMTKRQVEKFHFTFVAGRSKDNKKVADFIKSIPKPSIEARKKYAARKSKELDLVILYGAYHDSFDWAATNISLYS